MSEDVECDCKQEECEAGAPAWVMTFADLMSLLMCFFVLLLSFSEMDVLKFKQIAGSMKAAFGVQKQVKDLTEVPMGTSIIAQEFTPGKTDPTIIDDVRQITSKEEINLETAKEELERKKEEELEKKTKEMQLMMKEEIEQGLIEVDSMQDRIIIRIKEKGSFSSGEAELQEDFLPILERIRQQISTTEGTITVAGHTDDIPINTFRYRSNWELSSSRAVSVLQQLLVDGDIKPSDTEVKGLADTQPLVPNDSAENRATNRRVEIIIAPAIKTGDDDVIDAEDAAAGGGIEAPTEPAVESAPASIIPDLSGAITDDEALSAPLGTQSDNQIPESIDPFAGLGGETATDIVPAAEPPAAIQPIVIQDDAEVPGLQPELTEEIEDLFGTLENQ